MFRSLSTAAVLLALSCATYAQDFRVTVTPFISDSCLGCHDESTETALDFSSLGNDLDDESTFNRWVRVYDRVAKGEMPPPSAKAPDHALKRAAQTALSKSLTAHNAIVQKRNGRTILRRLTPIEYENTLHDLLDVDVPLKEMIPQGNPSGFDTVFQSQGISPLHIESYFDAVDAALDAAIQLTVRPESKKKRFPYLEQEGVRKHIDEAEKSDDEKLVVRNVDDGTVMFADMSYIFKLHGFYPEVAGKYRIRASAYSIQTDAPVIFRLNAGNYQLGSKRVLGFWDLKPDKPRKVAITSRFERGEYLFPAPDDLDFQEDGKNVWGPGADEYKGPGVVIQWIEVEGPLLKGWPPKSTKQLMHDVVIRKLDKPRWHNNQKFAYELVPGTDPIKKIKGIVLRLASRAFRRPMHEGEGRVFIELAQNVLDEGGSFEEAVRIACRGVLTSPQVLFMTPQAGELDEYSLATRLSYFLWKSMPDDELFLLARKGELSKPTVLREQVERLLDDPRSERFVKDFVGQWLKLRDIDATAPDKRLYPEFDELLQISMLDETYAFIRHLIEEDLPAINLIDSDFAMLNRRLAEHYDVPRIRDQHIRRVKLPKDSPRGGLLTHASIAKVTANGTVTSPVRRGSWVLDHLLGQPPSPPPPGIGSIEPDTRGTTTVRELLSKHRQDASCASCHDQIDPPGFAMESFDVIGGFRTHYRSLENGERPDELFRGRKIWEYWNAQPVDSTGTMPNGQSFEDITGFKKLLLNEQEQVVRNLISKLTVYATGAEIQFADRAQIEDILDKSRSSEYGLRTIIHAVVQSHLFGHK